MKNKIFIIIILLIFMELSAIAQWTNIWTNTGINASCFATSADSCFVTGGSGKIYRTINGGSTWDSVQTVFTTDWFNDIFFPSPNVGYACGGTAFGMHPCMIAKTTDGGQTWDSLLSNGGSYDFRKIFFVSDSVGYISGDYFVKTTDGGQTFTTIPIPRMVGAMYFFNDTSGLILTLEFISATKEIYRIERTDDGGTSWKTRYIDSISVATTIYNSRRLNDIYFTNSSLCYVVGDNGVYLTSADCGFSWTSGQWLNDSTNFADISISKNSYTGYIAAWKYDVANGYRSTIYKSVDAGFTWQLSYIDSLYGFYSVSMATDDTVYAATYGNIFKTANGGATYIHENKNQEYFLTFYPNPISDKFTIRNDESKINDVKVYNSLGQIIFCEFMPGISEIVIDASKWETGIYFLKVMDSKKQHIQKIIVTRN